MSIRFRTERRVTELLPAPQVGGAPTRRVSELRRDPLTGRGGRVAHFAGFQLVAPDLSRVIAASRAGCPFCPERILEVTPPLPRSIAPEGRIRRGEALLFPNISPYDRHSVVVSLTREHHLEMPDFTTAQLADGLLAAVQYFQALPRVARGTHSLITWNYMPPAGATQVHAHFQAFSTNRPGSLLEEEVRRSRAYWRRHGSSYWGDLAREERRLGERFLGAGQDTVWLTAFVSRSVVSDLLLLFPEVQRLEQLSARAATEFATGLRVALGAFHDEGIRSFNLAFYDAPSQEASPHLALHARVSPRIYFNPQIEGSDTTSWQHLLDEPFMVRSPEALATRLRPRFSGIF